MPPQTGRTLCVRRRAWAGFIRQPGSSCTHAARSPHEDPREARPELVDDLGVRPAIGRAHAYRGRLSRPLLRPPLSNERSGDLVMGLVDKQSRRNVLSHDAAIALII
jgi:hypothetical protein